VNRSRSRTFTFLVCYLIACRAAYELVAATEGNWSIRLFLLVVFGVPVFALLWLANKRIWRDLHHPKTLY
jgi:hypothetical protein